MQGAEATLGAFTSILWLRINKVSNCDGNNYDTQTQHRVTLPTQLSDPSLPHLLHGAANDSD